MKLSLRDLDDYRAKGSLFYKILNLINNKEISTTLFIQRITIFKNSIPIQKEGS